MTTSTRNAASQQPTRRQLDYLRNLLGDESGEIVGESVVEGEMSRADVSAWISRVLDQRRQAQRQAQPTTNTTDRRRELVAEDTALLAEYAELARYRTRPTARMYAIDSRRHQINADVRRLASQ